MVGLQVGSLADEEVLLVLLALKSSLSVPRRHFRQDFAILITKIPNAEKIMCETRYDMSK